MKDNTKNKIDKFHNKGSFSKKEILFRKIKFSHGKRKEECGLF